VIVVEREIVVETEDVVVVVDRVGGRVVVGRAVGAGRIVVGRVVGRAVVVVVGTVFVVVVVVGVWCPFGLLEGCNSGNCATSRTCIVSLNSVIPRYLASYAYRSSPVCSRSKQEPTPKTPHPSSPPPHYSRAPSS